jgi:hypothetical protein
VPGPNEASAVDGSREDELAGGAASSCGHAPAWRVCLCAVHGGSRARVQRVAGGRWRMADGPWQTADAAMGDGACCGVVSVVSTWRAQGCKGGR